MASGPHFEGLDGLRAIAVLAVLVFHLNPAWLPGGYLGVDLFFVISGFLITSLLVHEVASTGALDLKGFYLRRARRLLPALALVVAASSLLARLVSGDLVVGLGRQVFGAATFSTNWVEILAGQNYFDHTAPTLFMNFWSLAVEEQFYLLWPVAVFLLTRRVLPRLRVWVPLAMAGFSTLLMGLLVNAGQDATRIYYGTDTHLVGLMLGAALAFAWVSPVRIRIEEAHERYGWWAIPGAAIVLAGLMLLLDNDSPLTYRGGIALACVAACLLLIGGTDRIEGHRPTPLQRVLDCRPMVWLGRRSYGIYLWHWPVILIVGQLIPTAIGTFWFVLTRILAVGLTLAAAEASYRYLEMPIRRDGFRAFGAAVRARFVALPTRTRQLSAGVAALLALAFALTVITAPAQSSTAAELKANAAAAAAGAGTGKAVSTGVLPLSEAARKKGFAMPTGKEIDGFGDSMMVGGVHALEYYLPGIRMDAKSNRRWSDGLTAVRQRGSETRRAVVLDFGTNAGMDSQTMTAVLDALGPDRMVVLVNEYGSFSRVAKDNEILQQVVQGRPNVIIADWAAAVRSHPGALQSDGIHPSLRGSHYYAAAIREAFAKLSEQHTGTKVTLQQLPMP